MLSNALSLCFSVRVLHTSLFKINLHQISHTGKHQSGKELIKFWKSFALGSGSRTLLNDSSTLRLTRAFCNNFAHISGVWKNLPDLHGNFTTDVVTWALALNDPDSHRSSLDKDVFVEFRNSSGFALRISNSFVLLLVV